MRKALAVVASTEARTLEITVREHETGRVLGFMVLSVPPALDIPRVMRPATHSSAAPAEATASREAVAGRIDAAPSELDDAIEQWLAYLASRGKKRGSINAMRQVVRRAARESGWSTCSDLTFESVTGWLAGHRTDWKGTTYNRNMSCFRSLTKYLVAAKRIADDPMLLADRAEESGEDGSRAATTEEARALIRAAWARETADARCKGARSLYWLCLFAAGCRPNEPDQWRRRHLVLDHAIPHVFWEGVIQKSHRQAFVALAPELAGLLREHLQRIDLERAAAGLPPHGPDDPVFPVRPTKGVFAQDRRRAGICDVDYRRRPFTRRSGRKWFSTTLSTAGVPERLVDFLMRHRGRAEHRYYDPPLAEQIAALRVLPRLWPEARGGDGSVGSPRPAVDVENFPQNLTADRPGPDTAHRNRRRSDGEPLTQEQRDHASGPEPRPSDRQSHGAGQGSGAQSRLKGADGPGPDGSAVPDGNPGVLESEIAISDLKISGVSNSDLADLFEALARLLRKGAAHERE